MVYTACTYLILAGAAWIFLRLLQACFWLPRHLRKQNDIQQMLQDKVESYEKYVSECEEREKAAAELKETDDNDEINIEKSEKLKFEPIDEAKWKERRECLEMLKNELKRVRDGGEIHDWDHLLKDDEDELNESEKKEQTKSEDIKIADKVETEKDKMSDYTIGDTESSDSSVGKSSDKMNKKIEIKKDK